MDIERVKSLVRYAVAVASQKDDWQDRELGPIHLIKYVYLADLEYAKAHDGQTFTGANWIFYHFGPWDASIYQELEPALERPFTRKSFQSKYDDKDCVRWSLSPDILPEKFSQGLPVQCDLAIRGAVNRYGKDTKALLHAVYQTEPMRNAKPNEALKFHGIAKPVLPSPDPNDHNPALRKKLRALGKKWAAQEHDPNNYWYGGSQLHHEEGLAAFAAIEATELQNCTFDVVIDPSLWQWEARTHLEGP